MVAPGASDIVIPPEADAEEVFGYGEQDLFDIAETFGARSLNAVDVFGGDWSIAAATEAFAGLCDRAIERGLLVHIEWLPWSRIPDVATAWEIVRDADRPNGGIAVDAWHYVRSGADEATLRAIPGERILGLQLDDGPLAPEANLVEATLHERLLPGEGEFDLDALDDCAASVRRSGADRCGGLLGRAPRARRDRGGASGGDATRRLLAQV